MIYREVGQFKASYAADRAIFPIRQDRWLLLAMLATAYLVIPAVGSAYWLLTIMVPFLVYALAALGLNLLTGYAGQLSLGTGGFMAVGAFATYKLTTAFPGLNIILALILAGIITALEMPLAPAWPWVDVIVTFDDFFEAMRVGYDVALADGV